MTDGRRISSPFLPFSVSCYEAYEGTFLSSTLDFRIFPCLACLGNATPCSSSRPPARSFLLFHWLLLIIILVFLLPPPPSPSLLLLVLCARPPPLHPLPPRPVHASPPSCSKVPRPTKPPLGNTANHHPEEGSDIPILLPNTGPDTFQEQLRPQRPARSDQSCEPWHRCQGREGARKRGEREREREGVGDAGREVREGVREDR